MEKEGNEKEIIARMILKTVCQIINLSPDLTDVNNDLSNNTFGLLEETKAKQDLNPKVILQDHVIVSSDNEEQKKLPDIVKYRDVVNNLPPLADPLIEGILRKGHKMVISGGSKAGKSFLLIQLSIALAEGKPWLNYVCHMSKVLYVNLELDEASCYRRIADVYKALEIPPEHSDNLLIWSLRGTNVDLEKICNVLKDKLTSINSDVDVIVLDPIYKILKGDENSAKDTSEFLNQMDALGKEFNASIVYCQHHSKGSQTSKKAMDRLSGSGVFARDADALIDLNECKVDETTKQKYPDVTFHEITTTLREFPSTDGITSFFKYPCHHVITDATIVGKKLSPEDKIKKIKSDYGQLQAEKSQVTLDDMIEKTGWVKATVEKWLKTAGFIITKDKTIKIKKAG